MAWRELLDRNRRWAADRTAADPDFFARAAQEHRPKAIFVGCSDARVPCNLVTDTEVGELFVHRNVANQLVGADVSLSAGLQYAIDALEVQDVIVCGHHGCGGVRAAIAAEGGEELHLHHVDAWIAPLRRLARQHQAELAALGDGVRVDRLVELNVAEQVEALTRHPSVRRAWACGRTLRLHGWVYDLPSGLLQPRIRVDGPDQVHVGDAVLRSSEVTAQAK